MLSLKLPTSLKSSAFKDKEVSGNPNRKGIEAFNDLVCVNTFSRGEPIIAIVPVYYTKDVNPLCLSGRDIHILLMELPGVRHTAFGAYMTFIDVIKLSNHNFTCPIICIRFAYKSIKTR